MTVYRRASRERYVVIDNNTVRDPNLSLKATGLLVWLLSHSSDYPTSREEIARRKPDGTASIRTGLKELYDAHYLRHRREQDASGRWRTIVDVFELPTDNPEHPDHEPSTTEGGKPTSGHPHRRRDFRPPDNPPVREVPPRKTNESSPSASFRARQPKMPRTGELMPMDIERARRDLLGDGPFTDPTDVC